MNNRSASRDRASPSEDRHMNDQVQYGDCCRVVRESSIGSGWKRLTHVLAELEAPSRFASATQVSARNQPAMTEQKRQESTVAKFFSTGETLYGTR